MNPPVSRRAPRPNDGPAPALLSIAEAALTLGVTTLTIRGWIADGTIASLRYGHTERVAVSEIARLRDDIDHMRSSE